MSRLLRLLLFRVISPLLLSGCSIGYTRLMFVTKTNVGFEFDSKPPTLQLDINRLEGTIEPQFEGGKTLPLISSFKFLNRPPVVSPAVGSAFATGDAALAMAALYGQETSPSFWRDRLDHVDGAGCKSQDIDSALYLDEKPTIRTWWSRLCPRNEFQENEVRPVFFGTDTSLGLKLAWSGLAGEFPDTARLGYTRKELALVPITIQRMSKTCRTYRLRTASLLATVDAGVGQPAGKNDESQTRIEHVQFFATGDAATLLALQQDVRKAMLIRLDPNAPDFRNRFDQAFPGEAFSISMKLINDIYRFLKGSANAGRRADVIKEIVGELDEYANQYQLPDDLAFFVESNNTVRTEPNLKEIISEMGDFEKFKAYHTYLQVSIEALSRVGSDDVSVQTGDEWPNDSRTDRAKADELQDEQQKLLEKLQVEVITHRSVQRAVQYFYNMMKGAD